MTNEALDSSYEYDKGTLDNIYYFATEDNILYRVIFQGKDLVEVVFYPEVENDEGDTKPTTELTGTGNSRKVFGTVVKIMQEYVASYKPKALYFTADSSEPSRVKLYNRMTSQADKALPDYYATKPLDLGSGTAYMLKRKDTTVNEALDSSYPYEFKNNAYYFITDSGNDYKVILNGTKSVEVSFVWRGENNQPKDDISGTGDSRKVFGTVIKIVKDYVDQNNPKEIYFLADNNEPSRIKLYSAFAKRAAQVLPNYQSLSPLNNGATTEFVLQRKDLGRVEKATNNAKRLSRKALDKVFENKS